MLLKSSEKKSYAVKQGATLAYGGEVDKTSWLLLRTYCINKCTNEMSIMKKSIWTCYSIATFSTLDEVLEYANDSEYGLTSYVYTNNLNTIQLLMVTRIR